MTDEGRKNGTDADKMKEIMTIMSEKVPALLNSLADVLYGKEQSVKYGQAVAGFYKSLKDSGMTDEQAYELTKQYMSAMNLGGMIGQALRGGGGKGHGPGIAFKFKKGEHDEGDADDDEAEG
jgi:hypothetical protein